MLAPGLSEARDAVCESLLARAPADDLHLVGVTYNRGVDEWRDHAEAAAGGPPATARLVDTGGGDGSLPGVVEQGPEDLTGIEIAATDTLPYDDGETAFCFDSLTALLQYVDPDRAYRFVHALVERLWAAEAYAHFHMDPGAHDAETVVTLAALFDAVVTVDPEDAPVGVDATVPVGEESVGVARRPAVEPEGNA